MNRKTANKLIKKIFFGKKAFQPIFKKFFDISIEGLNIGTGGGSIYQNGELFAARYALSKEQTPIVFDVGAQGGDYIQAILNFSKNQAKIYAFEPCSRDYQLLKELFGEKITLVKNALGNTDGEGTLYYPNAVSGLSSLYKPHDGFTENEKVKIDTIDSFCKLNNIKNITLLKLDVEGNELACLQGAQQMLPNIKNIQFEFGISSMNARTYFRDIFNFLSDYKIYRILKDGLHEIKSPEKITELLFTTNYLAERMST